MESRSPPAIVVSNLTKAYRIWDRPSSRIVAPALETLANQFDSVSRLGKKINERARRHYRDFCALKDVSFELHRGQALGIVGRNGSGKSTLLQMIAGTLQPTAGEVASQGRVAALLELGSGFNPDFTGRENVYLNAAVLGLSRGQADERFERIAAFADIGEFIDEPVKIYSSGMVMRLAFAVAVHVDPDVLIVDEALSVGDARFSLKCSRAIDAILARGVSLLFVSHDLFMVKRLCSHALLLEEGRVLYGGKPNDVANLYSKLIAEGGSAASIADDIAVLRTRGSAQTSDAVQPESPGKRTLARVDERKVDAKTDQADNKRDAEVLRLQNRIKALEKTLTEIRPDAAWEKRVNALLEHDRVHERNATAEYDYGGELGRILSFQMLDREGGPRTWFTSGEDIEVTLEVEAFTDLINPIFALTIKDSKGLDVYGTNTLFSRQDAPPLGAGDRKLVRFQFPAYLITGEYFISLGFTQFIGEKLLIVHRRYDAIKFSIHATDRCFGIANCFAKITVESAPGWRTNHG